METQKKTEGFSTAEFTGRLVFFVFIVLVPMYVLAVFNIASQYDRALDDAHDEGIRLARAAAQQQRTAIQAVEPFLRAASKLPEVRNQSADACSAAFADILAEYPLFANIGAVAQNGDVFCSAVPKSGPVNATGREWFERAKKSGDFAFGEYEVSAITRLRTVNFGLPFPVANGETGVVYASLDVAQFSDIARDFRLPPDGTLTVFDRNGNVLSRFPDQERWVGRNVREEPVYRALFAGHLAEGIYEAQGLDGVNRVYAFAQLDPAVPGSPFVVIGFSKKNLLSDVRTLVLLNIFILLVITAVVIALAIVAGRELLVRRVVALGEINRLKGEFVSMVSHQLRTPLTSIRWLGELLLSGTAGPVNDTQRKMLEEMGVSAGQLVGLVNELLDLGRLDSGKLKVDKKEVDVPLIVADAMAQLEPLATAKGVTVEETFQGISRSAFADPMLVRQVTMNLLSNAIKYSEEKRPVVVTVVHEGRVIRVSVRDEGVGIPADEQKRIFERFFRASNVRSMRSDGTGLGLAVSRSMVEAMGGKIGFFSKQGEGSTFWFTLPSLSA